MFKELFEAQKSNGTTFYHKDLIGEYALLNDKNAKKVYMLDDFKKDTVRVTQVRDNKILDQQVMSTKEANSFVKMLKLPEDKIKHKDILKKYNIRDM